PDIVLTHKGVPVGCGEIKPFSASRASIDDDRARIAEFMKRALHERIIQAQSEDEFAVIGFFVVGRE
ncbi:hypothetical protein BCR41DRAFT_283451, partial [Lobosporangium transversale]